jgi:hypothetical protein
MIEVIQFTSSEGGPSVQEEESDAFNCDTEPMNPADNE